MEANEKTDINNEFPSSILNTPKIKLKKPKKKPTPFSLNDTTSKEDINSDDNQE